MRRRSTLVLGGGLAIAGAAAFLAWSVGARDALGRGAAAGTGTLTVEPAAPAGLPTYAEVRHEADRAALGRHVGRLEEALAAAAAAGAPAARRGELHTLLSVALRLLGEHEPARAHADAAVALAPASSRAHEARAWAIATGLADAGKRRGWTAVLARLPDVGLCKGELAAAVALDPRNFDARDAELALYLYAPWPVGGRAAARERIATLELVDARRATLWRAQDLEQAGRAQEGLAVLDGARDLPRELAERATFVRGELLKSLGRDREAAAAYEALLAGPVRRQAWYLAAYEAARCRQRAGDGLERAVALYDELLRADPAGELVPEPADVAYRKGVALQGLGRAPEARAAFERALELEPSHRRARAALKAL